MKFERQSCFSFYLLFMFMLRRLLKALLYMVCEGGIYRPRITLPLLKLIEPEATAMPPRAVLGTC